MPCIVCRKDILLEGVKLKNVLSKLKRGENTPTCSKECLNKLKSMLAKQRFEETRGKG